MPFVQIDNIHPGKPLYQALGYEADDLPAYDRPLSVLSLPEGITAGLQQVGIKSLLHLLRSRIWDLYQVPGVPVTAAQDVADRAAFWLRRRRVALDRKTVSATVREQVPPPPQVPAPQESSAPDGEPVDFAAAIMPVVAEREVGTGIPADRQETTASLAASGPAAAIRIDVQVAPPDKPLLSLLGLPWSALAHLDAVSVAVLSPSVRGANCLEKAGIVSLADMARLDLDTCWRLRNMGRKTLQELVDSLTAYVGGSAGATGADTDHAPYKRFEGTPLLLRAEWLLFSGGKAAPTGAPLKAIPVDSEIHSALRTSGISTIPALLEWPVSNLMQAVGPEAALDVLDALAVLATDYRQSRSGAGDTPSADGDVPAVLQERWAACPVDQLGLGPWAVSRLREGGFKSLGGLHTALSGAHPALYFDLPLFFETWARLCVIGLRNGDAASHRREWGEAQDAPTLASVLTSCRDRCKPREWSVLSARYGLREDPELQTPSAANQPDEAADADPVPSRRIATLGQLAVQLDMSREGVRHIERRATDAISRPGSLLTPLAASVAWLMAEAGGILSLSDCLADLEPYIPAGATDAEGLLYLACDLDDRFVSIERANIYALASTPHQEYGRIVGVTRALWRRSTDNLRGERLVERVLTELSDLGADVSERFVRACLRADGRFLDEDRRSEAVSRGLNALIVDALRLIGAPAHFTRVAEEINRLSLRKEPVTTNSVHGRLTGCRELFVYTGPGTYGLVEWGLEDGRLYDRRQNGFIGDLAEEFLEQQGEPMLTAEIVAYVLSRKRCRQLSIEQCLYYGDRFRRFGKHRYGLKKWVF